jgi:hypothetical protein
MFCTCNLSKHSTSEPLILTKTSIPNHKKYGCDLRTLEEMNLDLGIATIKT